MPQIEESYDAVLIVSFGGPEGPEDVMPFLENVVRGRPVPRERLLEVAAHYELFGGVSPINGQNRALRAALEAELAAHGHALRVYWGNRNWQPFLADTLREMRTDGVRRALGFFTTAYASYSGCRQYLENIAAARAEVGVGAPVIDKLRVFYDHPGFIEPMVERVRDALREVPAERRAAARLVFTAHSVPMSMARTSAYVAQLEDACRRVRERVGEHASELAWQSRSGPPEVPWLEPDILVRIRALATEGVRDVVVVPIGFVSDHMEVVYDLDIEAREVAREVGVSLVRAGTVGTHPRFVQMVRELIEERLSGGPAATCAPDCCPAPARRA